jgi:hypothetical protein
MGYHINSLGSGRPTTTKMLESTGPPESGPSGLGFTFLTRCRRLTHSSPTRDPLPHSLAAGHTSLAARRLRSPSRLHPSGHPIPDSIRSRRHSEPRPAPAACARAAAAKARVRPSAIFSSPRIGTAGRPTRGSCPPSVRAGRPADGDGGEGARPGAPPTGARPAAAVDRQGACTSSPPGLINTPPYIPFHVQFTSSIQI